MEYDFITNAINSDPPLLSRSTTANTNINLMSSSDFALDSLNQNDLQY